MLLHKEFNKFASPCGKIEVFIENDIPIGYFHDFLTEIKGMMVDRMVKAHKDHLKEIEEQENIIGDNQ